uniref:Uncharacterized protein n=1 Tax=Cannabis sativa TaxID=3483 RepID=A0A803PHZ3_CANSA
MACTRNAPLPPSAPRATATPTISSFVPLSASASIVSDAAPDIPSITTVPVVLLIVQELVVPTVDALIDFTVEASAILHSAPLIP